MEQSRRDKEAKNQLKCQVQALSSCIWLMVGDSFLDPNSSMEIIGDPKKMFDEETIQDIGECQTYGKMVKGWVKSMEEWTSSLFQEVKVTTSLLDLQWISNELAYGR